MAEIEVRNWDNEVVGSLALEPAVFDYPLKKHLIYEAVLAHRAAARGGHHKVKNRSEVSGGTRKLWRQKHTGRARMGDNRSPVWRHGGTVHGPRPRSYDWRIPNRMRRNALRSALAQKFRDGEILCMDSLERDTHKTKDLRVALQRKTGLDIKGKALLVSHGEERNLSLAAGNLAQIKAVRALGVNIYDMLYHDTLIITQDALKQLSEVLAR